MAHIQRQPNSPVPTECGRPRGWWSSPGTPSPPPCQACKSQCTRIGRYQEKGCFWQMNQNIFFGNNTMRPNPSSGTNMNHFHLAQWSNYESAPLYNIFVSVTRKASFFLPKHKWQGSTHSRFEVVTFYLMKMSNQAEKYDALATP